MDQFKFSLGPYELFSSIISGVPILIAILLSFYDNLSVESDPLSIVGDISFTSFVIIAVLSYLAGVVMSGPSFVYFKVLCRITRKDFSRTEKKMLRDLTNVDVHDPELGKADKRFETRLAYLVKRQLGDSSYGRVCTRLLPFLRKYAPGLGAHADQFMAQKIMLRNISLGFFVLALVLLVKALMLDINFIALYVVSVLCLVVALFSFNRALTFRGWWAREILLGFYHHALGQEGEEK